MDIQPIKTEADYESFYLWLLLSPYHSLRDQFMFLEPGFQWYIQILW